MHTSHLTWSQRMRWMIQRSWLTYRMINWKKKKETSWIIHRRRQQSKPAGADKHPLMAGEKNHQSILGPEQFSACTLGKPQHGSLRWLNWFTIYFQLQHYLLSVFSDELDLSLNSKNKMLATKCWARRLEQMTHCGPFQPGPFCDSVVSANRTFFLVYQVKKSRRKARFGVCSLRCSSPQPAPVWGWM